MTRVNNIYCKRGEAVKMNTITDFLKFKMKLDILKCIRIFLLKIETKLCIAVAVYLILKFFVHRFHI